MSEISLELLLDARLILDLGQFEDGLGIVGDGAVGIDGDRHGPHREETERDETEREHRRGEHELLQAERRDAVGPCHQAGDRHADPVAGEVAGDQTREDVEARSTLMRGDDDFLRVLGAGGGEHLDQLGDQRARDGAARQDQRELPPEAVTEIRDEEVGGDEGRDDAHDGGDPDELRQGLLEVHVEILGMLLRERVIDEV